MKPDGTAIDSRAPNPNGNWAQLPIQHERDGIHINARTAATRWAGERCDYDPVVAALMGRRKRAKDVGRPLVE